MNSLRAWPMSCRGRRSAPRLMGFAIWIAMLLGASLFGERENDDTTGIRTRVDPIGETFGLVRQPLDDAIADPGRFWCITGQ